jgi:hypothetical protein
MFIKDDESILGKETHADRTNQVSDVETHNDL